MARAAGYIRAPALSPVVDPEVAVAGEGGGLVCRVVGGRATLTVRVGEGTGLFGADEVGAGEVTVVDAGPAVRLRRDAFGSEEAVVAPDAGAARAALDRGGPADRVYLPAGRTGPVDAEVVTVPPGGVESVDLGTRGLRGGRDDRKR